MIETLLPVALTRVWQGRADPAAKIAATAVTAFAPLPDGGEGGFYALTRAGGMGLVHFTLTANGIAVAGREAVTGQPVAGQEPGLALLDLDGGARLVLTGLPGGGGMVDLSGAAAGGVGRAVALPAGTLSLRVAEIALPAAPAAGATAFAFGRLGDGQGMVRWTVDAGGTLSAPVTVDLRLSAKTLREMEIRDIALEGDLLVAAARGPVALLTWKVGAGGALTPVAQVAGADLGTSGAEAVALVALGGTHYAVLAGQGGGTLDILRIDAQGRAVAVDHVLDTLGTRFAKASELAVAVAGDRAFIAVSGSDDGVSLFQLLPNGRLLHMATLEDTLTTTLDAVGALSLSLHGDTLRLMAAGGSGASVTVVDFTLPAAGATYVATAGGQTIAGTARADILIGAGGNDTLSGGAGNDILIDGGGRDRLTGGAGADVFILEADGQSDTITDFQRGIDRIDLSAWTRLRGVSQLSYTARADGAVLRYANEELVIRAADGETLTWAELLRAGLVGLDRLLPDWRESQAGGGFAGTPDNGYTLPDRYKYVPPAAPAPPPADPVENHIPYHPYIPPDDGGSTEKTVTSVTDLSGPLRGEKVFRAASGSGVTLTGTAGADLLIGGAGHDTLIGNGGDDRLAGGAGNDVMRGGAGSDRYFVTDAGDRVIENATDAGTDTVYAWVSFAMGAQHIENLVLMGTGAIDATGNALANEITGNAAANRIDGGRGSDVMRGGGGDDLYLVRDAGDRTVEAAGGGHDTVWAYLSWVMQAETERGLLKSTAAHDLTGNAKGNELAGNTAANVINGKGGQDFLRGYGGRDTFVFDQPAGRAHADRIRDFTPGEDRIALSSTIFGLAKGLLDAGAFSDTGAATSAATRIVYDKDSGWLSFDPDGTGPAGLSPFARLWGAPEIGAGDFTVF